MEELEVTITVDDQTFEVVRAMKDMSEEDKKKVISVIAGINLERQISVRK